MDLFTFAGQAFALTPEGLLWWPARRALLAADLHLEKASACAGNGYALPPYDTGETLDLIAAAIACHKAVEVWCLGDSFHDPGAFERLTEASRTRLHALTALVDWTWITGNHDPDVTGVGGLSRADALIDGIVLRHAAEASFRAPEISGHFHPKFRLRTHGRTITRRCALRSATRLMLPALGAFTGGLDAADPAIATLMSGPYEALIATRQGLLRMSLTQTATPA